ncbi:glutamine amidotransferase [Vogesella indigofera]|uniref:glutamine amidotransferase n=1 Tax=Vogesella indigofera TaxID=45465 RepID=UPI00234F14C9|nr:glutamine amidotransferase [Vogesella indigofera]MDC7701659.1 glutamine amidotransferase [Vogesella indigofera]
MSTEPKPLLLLQVGTPPDEIRMREGDLSDWFRAALNIPLEALKVIRVFEGEALPEPCAHQPAIITGSWAMVTDRLGWSETTAEWIRQAMLIDQPLFGVCYGHQLMAHALGGRVGYHPGGLELGCLPVRLEITGAKDALVGTMPSQFLAHLTHMQSVLAPPPQTVVLARSEHDQHQILRYGPNAISTQFHPEFTRSILAACVDTRTDFLRSRGCTPEALKTNACDTPQPRELLQRFVRTYLHPELLEKV